MSFHSCHILQILQEVQNPQMKRYSISTQSSHCSLTDLLELSNQTQTKIEKRDYLFKGSQTVKIISAKANRKAINWILSICWSRGYSTECILTTIMLYYIYKTHRSVDKNNIEVILLTCMQLASKYSEKNKLSVSDILLLCSKPISRYEIFKIEGEILQLIDFNLIIPNYLELMIASDEICQDVKDKILFICELYLTKDFQILFDHEKLNMIKLIVKGESTNIEIVEQIRDMVDEKENKIIINKYYSKLDIELFLIEIL